MSPTPIEECEGAPELKSCPFCGGKPFLDNLSESGTERDSWYVHCTICEIQQIVNNESRAVAIALWNRRPDPVRASWQPIETAPKDGTTIMGYDAQDGDPIQLIKWDADEDHVDKEFWIADPGGWPVVPTDWMPLPTPPGSAPLADTSGSMPSNSSSDPVRVELLAALKEARQELYDERHSHMSEAEFANSVDYIDAAIARAERLP